VGAWEELERLFFPHISRFQSRWERVRRALLRRFDT
jgi:hypothetical protein